MPANGSFKVNYFLMFGLNYNTPARYRYQSRHVSSFGSKLQKAGFFAGMLVVLLIAIAAVPTAGLTSVSWFGTTKTTSELNVYRPTVKLNSRDYIESIVRRASKEYQIPSELVRAVIKVESNFNPKAVSHVGAMGLMQLMPGTAKDLGVEDPYDPIQNVYGGTKYLSKLIKRYDGNWKLALAAYNAGPRSVAKYGGVPPYKETQQYVKKVLKLYKRSRKGAPLERSKLFTQIS